MELFYFGDGRLFGAFHPASSGARPRGAVVLCYPILQEYIRAHRPFLHLARQLADDGFDCMRFDYFGCGDSQGEGFEGAVEQWQGDIGTAIDEIVAGTDASHVCMLGLRFGATLAARVCAGRSDVDRLVLWDPVVNGRDYLHELNTQHHEWLRGSFAKERDTERPADASEVLGFEMSGSVRDAVGKADLLHLSEPPAQRVLIVETKSLSAGHPLHRHLEQLGATVDTQHIAAAAAWQKSKAGVEGDLGDTLVPTQTLDAIVTWLKGSAR